MKLTNVLALGKDFWGKAFEEWECVCGAVVAVPTDALLRPQCPNCGNYLQRSNRVSVLARRLSDAWNVLRGRKIATSPWRQP